MRESTEICEKANPDFIDINYGCPVKKVTCKGAGSGILRYPKNGEYDQRNSGCD